MTCLRCGFDNPIPARFCVRCHEPLWFACPSCGHVQGHGGTCAKCGVDFAKFGVVLAVQHESRAQQERERRNERRALWKQILLLPITGGFSLIRHLFARARRD